MTDEIRAMCKNHLPEIQSHSQKHGRNGLIDDYEVVDALSQVVAGVNYYLNIKVLSSTDEHIWVRIHEDLEGKSHLHAVQVGKAGSDVITYFED